MPAPDPAPSPRTLVRPRRRRAGLIAVGCAWLLAMAALVAVPAQADDAPIAVQVGDVVLAPGAPVTAAVAVAVSAGSPEPTAVSAILQASAVSGAAGEQTTATVELAPGADGSWSGTAQLTPLAATGIWTVAATTSYADADPATAGTSFVVRAPTSLTLGSSPVAPALGGALTLSGVARRLAPDGAGGAQMLPWPGADVVLTDPLGAAQTVSSGADGTFTLATTYTVLGRWTAAAAQDEHSVAAVGSAAVPQQVAVTTTVDKPVVALYAAAVSTLTVTARIPVGATSVPVSVVGSLASDLRSTGAPNVDRLSVPMTRVGENEWRGTVTTPRVAVQGGWTATVSAVASGWPSATASTRFSVRRNTLMSLSFSPSAPGAGARVTVTGRLTRMRPGASAAENGTYFPYAGQRVTLTGPGLSSATYTTDAKGQFRYVAASVTATASWKASFAGTPYHQPSSTTVTLPVVRNATRFVSFNAGPEPVYRGGYVTISGYLQRNDPNTRAWMPYSGKTIRITRSGYAYTATTDSRGYFALTVRGGAAATTGTWYATFDGTAYHAPTRSGGDAVATTTTPFRLTKVAYDGPGDDLPVSNSKLNAEYVVVKNIGTQYGNLNGWTISDRAGHAYRVPVNVYVPAGGSVAIHTGAGTNIPTHLYWSAGYYIWNNTGDDAYLRSDTGGLVDTCSWSGGSGTTAC